MQEAPKLPVSGERPVLVYAGRCPKCRFLSWLVVALSFHTVQREPLESERMRKFYFEDYPQARGYPVLFERGRPLFGARVFLAVPWLLLRTWTRRLLPRRGPPHPSDEAQR